MKQEKTASARPAEKNKLMPLIIALTVVTVLAAAALIVYAVKQGVRTDPKYFTITDGVVTEYTGTDERTVTLPDGVVVVGERAFIGHEEIEKLVLPATLTTLRNGAFYGCANLREISFAGALSFIGDAAFGGCTSLTEITLPASVQYIHSEAFYGDTALTAISVAEGNENFLSLDGVLYTADAATLLTYPAGRTAVGYSLSEQTETIAMGAFLGNTYLQEIGLGQVREIGTEAFLGCTGIESLTLPGTVEKVYDNAFEGCAGLKELKLEEGVKIFGTAAFADCAALTRVELPESMEEIGPACFHDCTALSYVSFPAEMMGIFETAFEGCSALTIYGYADSPAQAYAETYEIPFETLD